MDNSSLNEVLGTYYQQGGQVDGKENDTKKTERKIVKVPDGKICDYIDGKFRKDTPEEYVRQTIEKRLVNEHKYKPDQIRVEFGIKMGSRRPRADIVIFPKDSPKFTQDYIEMIIECKSEKVEHKNKKDGVGQLKSYMSACPNCEWGMWTNGKYKEVLRKVKIEGKYEFQEYNDIPPADGSLEDMSDEESMAFGLVDNRSQETSEWNFAKLQDNLNTINDNFKPGELGFDDEFLDKAFEGFDEIEKMFNADETDKNKDKNAPQFIKIVIRAEDLSIIEKAITATNANTRGKALATICRDYLNNEKNIKKMEKFGQ